MSPDFKSPTWRWLEGHLDCLRNAASQALEDDSLSDKETSALRARIAVYRALLALPETHESTKEYRGS